MESLKSTSGINTPILNVPHYEQQGSRKPSVHPQDNEDYYNNKRRIMINTNASPHLATNVSHPYSSTGNEVSRNSSIERSNSNDIHAHARLLEDAVLVTNLLSSASSSSSSSSSLSSRTDERLRTSSNDDPSNTLQHDAAALTALQSFHETTYLAASSSSSGSYSPRMSVATKSNSMVHSRNHPVLPSNDTYSVSTNDTNYYAATYPTHVSPTHSYGYGNNPQHQQHLDHHHQHHHPSPTVNTTEIRSSSRKRVRDKNLATTPSVDYSLIVANGTPTDDNTMYYPNMNTMIDSTTLPSSTSATKTKQKRASTVTKVTPSATSPSSTTQRKSSGKKSKTVQGNVDYAVNNDGASSSSFDSHTNSSYPALTTPSSVTNDSSSHLVTTLTSTTEDDDEITASYRVHQPGPESLRNPKKAWNAAEDDLLRDAYMRISSEYEDPIPWNEVANLVPERTGKQCRERWVHHLQPAVHKGDWTEEEDQLIFEQMKIHGKHWANIAKAIPGRTDHAIKNRYYSTCRRMLRQQKKRDAEYMNNNGGNKDGKQHPHQETVHDDEKEGENDAE